MCPSSSSRRPSFHRILRVFEALPTGTYVSRLIGLPMRSPLHALATRSRVPRKRKCARSFPPLSLSLSLSSCSNSFILSPLPTLSPPRAPESSIPPVTVVGGYERAFSTNKLTCFALDMTCHASRELFFRVKIATPSQF